MVVVIAATIAWDHGPGAYRAAAGRRVRSLARLSQNLSGSLAWVSQDGPAYLAVAGPTEYAPLSRSSMRAGPTGVQPRSSRVAVLVAARSMAKNRPIHPK